MKVRFFGTNRFPVVDFLKKLPSKEHAIIAASLDCIRKNGFDCSQVEFRQLLKKLWEIKIYGIDSAYRIFYVNLRTEIILLHAYKKQTQKAPLKELKIAQKRLTEVLQNEITFV